jgi:hypothetical protein
VLRPDLPREIWERARWGTSSSGGILLTISQPSRGGPIRLVFRNVSDHALPFMLGAGGDELSFELRDEQGRAIDAPPPAPPPRDEDLGEGLAPVAIAPGEAVSLDVPVARVALRPGRYTVVVERGPLLPDKLRLRSNAIAVEAR